MYGLGKRRSRFGRWADRKGLTQQELTKICGINKSTMSEICSNDDHNPQIATKTKIVSALRKNRYDVEMADFWD